MAFVCSRHGEISTRPKQTVTLLCYKGRIGSARLLLISYRPSKLFDYKMEKQRTIFNHSLGVDCSLFISRPGIGRSLIRTPWLLSGKLSLAGTDNINWKVLLWSNPSIIPSLLSDGRPPLKNGLSGLRLLPRYRHLLAPEVEPDEISRRSKADSETGLCRIFVCKNKNENNSGRFFGF